MASDEVEVIPATRKEAVWLGCRTKTCCFAPLVVPSGRDIWRIARQLDVPPWSFLLYLRSPEPRPDAFLLEPDGPLYRLALAKRQPRRRAAPPCTFLLRLRDGQHRCGLGDQRPGVCRAFPAESRGGLLRIVAQPGCQCRLWSLADLDLPAERRLLTAIQAEMADYAAVVAHWNAWLRAEPPGTQVDFFAYCDYLMDAYDDRAASSGGEADQ